MDKKLRLTFLAHPVISRGH